MLKDLSIRNTEELSLIWNNSQSSKSNGSRGSSNNNEGSNIITAPTNEPNSRQAMVQQQHRQSTPLPRSTWSRVMLSVVAGTMAPNERNVKRRHHQQQQHQAFLATARDWCMTSATPTPRLSARMQYALTSREKRSVQDLSDILRCSLHGEKDQAGASQVHADCRRPVKQSKEGSSYRVFDLKGTRVPHETQATTAVAETGSSS
jgi:hypothetical protein